MQVSAHSLLEVLACWFGRSKQVGFLDAAHSFFAGLMDGWNPSLGKATRIWPQDCFLLLCCLSSLASCVWHGRDHHCLLLHSVGQTS